MAQSTTEPGVARQLVTFLASPRKVTKRRRPQVRRPFGLPFAAQSRGPLAKLGLVELPVVADSHCARPQTLLADNPVRVAEAAQRGREKSASTVRAPDEARRLCRVRASCAAALTREQLRESQREAHGRPHLPTQRARLSLLTFFGEAKKVSGSGAAPRIGLDTRQSFPVAATSASASGAPPHRSAQNGNRTSSEENWLPAFAGIGSKYDSP
jgi:hypothetical protein